MAAVRVGMAGRRHVVTARQKAAPMRAAFVFRAFALGLPIALVAWRSDGPGRPFAIETFIFAPKN